VANPNFFIFRALFLLAFVLRAVANVAVRAAADLVNLVVRDLIPVAAIDGRMAGIALRKRQVAHEKRM
jgi:hypothetical protein